MDEYFIATPEAIEPGTLIFWEGDMNPPSDKHVRAILRVDAEKKQAFAGWYLPQVIGPDYS